MHAIYTWPWIQAQSERAIRAWCACARLPLPSGPHFTPWEQHRREKAYDQAMRAVEREISSAPLTRSRCPVVQKRLNSVFPTFAAAALGLESKAIRLIADGFLPAGIEFARSAHAASTPPSAWPRLFRPAATPGPSTDCSLSSTSLRASRRPSSVQPSLPLHRQLSRSPRCVHPRTNVVSARDFRQRLRGERLLPLTMRTRHPSGSWSQ